MDKRLIDKDWKYLCQYLPDNLSDLAKATGAVVRWRHLQSGEELLRIILAYAMEDLSLRSTAAWSSQAALELKDTSVLAPFAPGSAAPGEGLGALAHPATARRGRPRPGVSDQ